MDNPPHLSLQRLIEDMDDRRVVGRCTYPCLKPCLFPLQSAPDADLLLFAVRAHWPVENNFHWTLDVVFRADDARLSLFNGARNFAILYRIALNILKRHSAKVSHKCKRFKAALDDSFLAQCFAHF
jgi:hypothetical protein